MPTVLRRAGFEVRIYTDDHAPAHVHVIKAGERLAMNLGSDVEAPSIRENVNMKVQEARRAVRIVEENQEYLLQRWREIHG